MLPPAFYSTPETVSMLNDADFRFPDATTAGGQSREVTQGAYQKMLANPDRELRRAAWQGYMDTYLAFKNTLANNMNTSLQQNVFNARVRCYNSETALTGFFCAIMASISSQLVVSIKIFISLAQFHLNHREQRSQSQLFQFSNYPAICDRSSLQ